MSAITFIATPYLLFKEDSSYEELVNKIHHDLHFSSKLNRLYCLNFFCEGEDKELLQDLVRGLAKRLNCIPEIINITQDGNHLQVSARGFGPERYVNSLTGMNEETFNLIHCLIYDFCGGEETEAVGSFSVYLDKHRNTQINHEFVGNLNRFIKNSYFIERIINAV